MGEQRADGPSIHERTAALTQQLEARESQAEQQWGAHVAGLSQEQHDSLRKLLTRVQEMIRETSLDEPEPKKGKSRKEEAEHGLEVITNRINKKAESFAARTRETTASSNGLAL
jgi:hypothetical protein